MACGGIEAEDAAAVAHLLGIEILVGRHLESLLGNLVGEICRQDNGAVDTLDELAAKARLNSAVATVAVLTVASFARIAGLCVVTMYIPSAESRR